MDHVSVAPKKLLTYVILLFLLAGCARQIPTLEPADMPASVIVERLEKKEEQLRSFRAVGSIQLRGEKQRWSGRAFVLVQLPSSLRLEVMNFFGQPVMYAASDGSEFVIWQPGENRAYQGLAARGTLARLINFPLRDQEAALLLAGIVPTWEQGEQELFKLSDTGGMLLKMEDTPSRLTQKVWLKAESGDATKIERLRGGKRELEATFSDFKDLGGWSYPKSIMMEGAKTRVTIHYERIAINEHVDQSVFHLSLPKGVEIIPW
jgi:outer membrane lipoprotein-sorting protein